MAGKDKAARRATNRCAHVRTSDQSHRIDLSLCNFHTGNVTSSFAARRMPGSTASSAEYLVFIEMTAVNHVAGMSQ